MRASRLMNHSRTGRLLVGSLVLILAFAGACLAIRPAFPFPDIPLVRHKLAQFRAHANDYDTLFVGSSRINFQVIPAKFDQLTRAAGLPTKSFNAGVAGMRPPEDTYFFDQLLTARPQRLRWVFIELGSIRPHINEEVRGTMRAQYWHDWSRMRLLWQRIWQPDPDGKSGDFNEMWNRWCGPAAMLPEHLGLFLREMSNLGRGDFLSRYLIEKPRDWRRKLPKFLGPDLAGWTPTGRGESMTPQNLAAFEAGRAERRVQPAVHDLGDPVSQDALEAMIAKVEGLGAEPVLIVAPVTLGKNFFPRPERAQRTTVLDFSDMERFPELYENRNRLDTDHLNTAGAEVFTRLLAEQWAAVVKARGAAR